MARTAEPDPPRTLSGNTMSMQKGGSRSRLFMVLIHVDCNPDLRVHIRLAERGAFLQYDTPGRTKYQPEGTTIELMRRLFDAGYGKNLLLGGQGAAIVLESLRRRARPRLSAYLVYPALT